MSFWVVTVFLVSCAPAQAQSIDITYEGTRKLALHQETQLTALVNPAKAASEVTWSSSNPETISVSDSGLAIPLAIGEATITATSVANPVLQDTIDLESYCLVDEIEALQQQAPSYDPLTEYHPTRFQEDSWNVVSSDSLADGADLVKVSLKLNDGSKVIANVMESDLTKSVKIESGTYDNLPSATGKKQPLYGQIQAYEIDHPDRKVVAATNADFFGNFPVNAFIKDDIIVKDAHNDNGGYDYTNTNYDIPASMPILFGVANGFAQVGAIVDNKDVEHTVKSKFTYTVNAISSAGSIICSYENSQRNVFTSPDNARVNFISTSSRQAKAPANSTVYTLKPHYEAYETHGEVVTVEKTAVSIALPVSKTNYYVIVPDALANPSIKIGDFFSYNIASEDGKWDHYQQILGARQELVHNGQVVSTVVLENTNGAQTTNIPRTAIGVMPDGKVALFAIESMPYGGFAATEDDSFGVSLPELAEIMRYFGCVNAGNFDGGGSTQLIVDKDGVDQVVVRSSDYGTYVLEEGRAVVNSVLITAPAK